VADKIGNGCLNVLGDLYRLVGAARGADHLELALPVQLVHDVSREAEFGALSLSNGGRGYWFINMPIISAAGGTEDDSVIIDAEFIAEFQSVDAPGVEHWAMDVFLTDLSANQLTACGLGLAFNANFPSAPSNGLGLVPLASYANTVREFFAGQFAAQPRTLLAEFPIHLPPGAVFNSRLVAAAALTAQAVLVIWSGPQGTRPPGVA